VATGSGCLLFVLLLLSSKGSVHLALALMLSAVARYPCPGDRGVAAAEVVLFFALGCGRQLNMTGSVVSVGSWQHHKD
jgi:hypothetical protein